MRIQLLSDLHTEFHYSPLDFLDSLSFATDLDVLVLAGDVVVPCSQDINHLTGVLSTLSSKAPDIVWVSGNHDYYHGTRERAEAALKAVLPNNFHWLHNSDVEIKGQHFFGGTMWFEEDPMNIFHKRNMCDFEVIANLSDWVYTENRLFNAAAWRLITPDSVVVTHHLPSNVCIAPQFKGSNLNRFFVCDQTRLIEEKKPKLWVYGHTHLPYDGLLGETRLICNPYGYPQERKFFRKYPPVVVEI